MAVAALCATATPASAAPGITVSKSTGLDPAGDTITVSGSGFDEAKGIYVAVCVDNGPGQVPTPCLGGADTSGGGGGSKWISSNPPNYGKGLTTPYGPGGTFTVTLSVVAVDPVTGTDCTKVQCSAVTRADHTRTSDRSQDSRVPLTFGLPPAPTTTTTTTVAAPLPPPTTTTTTSTTTTTTSSSAAPAVENTAAQASPDGTGWWVGGGAAVLLAAVAVLVLRARGRRTGTD
jgi:cell division septation protein DedD